MDVRLTSALASKDFVTREEYASGVWLSMEMHRHQPACFTPYTFVYLIILADKIGP